MSFFDLLDMTMAYVQYLYILISISPSSFPDFYVEPFRTIRYVALDFIGRFSEENHYSNPLEVLLPAWLPLDYRIQFVLNVIVSPLIVALVGILVVCSTTAFCWMLMTLAALASMMFGLLLLVMPYIYPEEEISRSTRVLLVSIGAVCTVICVSLGMFGMYVFRLRKRKEEDAVMADAPDDLNELRPATSLAEKAVSRLETNRRALAALCAYENGKKRYLRRCYPSIIVPQAVAAVAVLLAGIILTSAVPIESIQFFQLSPVGIAVSCVLLVAASLTFVWVALGTFKKGRKLQLLMHDYLSGTVLGTIMIFMSFIYSPVLMNVINILWCVDLTCYKGEWMVPPGALANNYGQSNLWGTGDTLCYPCNFSMHTQQCPESLQTEFCGTTRTEARLVYDMSVPCKEINWFYKIPVILVLLSYSVLYPIFLVVVADRGSKILEREYPLEKRLLDEFTERELYYEKVRKSANVSAPVYQAYKRRYRKARLTFVLQRVLIVTISCMTARGLEDNLTWLGLGLILTVCMTYFLYTLILKPFARPVENYYSITSQFLIACVASIGVAGNRLGKEELPKFITIFLAVCVFLGPLLTLMIGLVRTFRKDREREERLQRRLEKGFVVVNKEPNKSRGASDSEEDDYSSRGLGKHNAKKKKKKNMRNNMEEMKTDSDDTLIFASDVMNKDENEEEKEEEGGENETKSKMKSLVSNMRNTTSGTFKEMYKKSKRRRNVQKNQADMNEKKNVPRELQEAKMDTSEADKEMGEKDLLMPHDASPTFLATSSSDYLGKDYLWKLKTSHERLHAAEPISEKEPLDQTRAMTLILHRADPLSENESNVSPACENSNDGNCSNDSQGLEDDYFRDKRVFIPAVYYRELSAVPYTAEDTHGSNDKEEDIMLTNKEGEGEKGQKEKEDDAEEKEEEKMDELWNNLEMAPQEATIPLKDKVFHLWRQWKKAFNINDTPLKYEDVIERRKELHMSTGVQSRPFWLEPTETQEQTYSIPGNSLPSHCAKYNNMVALDVTPGGVITAFARLKMHKNAQYPPLVKECKFSSSSSSGPPMWKNSYKFGGTEMDFTHPEVDIGGNYKNIPLGISPVDNHVPPPKLEESGVKTAFPSLMNRSIRGETTPNDDTKKGGEEEENEQDRDEKQKSIIIASTTRFGCIFNAGRQIEKLERMCKRVLGNKHDGARRPTVFDPVVPKVHLEGVEVDNWDTFLNQLLAEVSGPTANLPDNSTTFSFGASSASMFTSTYMGAMANQEEAAAAAAAKKGRGVREGKDINKDEEKVDEGDACIAELATVQKSAEEIADSSSVRPVKSKRVQLLLRHCFLRHRLCELFKEQKKRLRALQQAVDFRIDVTIKKYMQLFFLGLSVCTTVALVVCLCGMLGTDTKGFVDGIWRDNSVDRQLLGYDNWEEFTSHCCCMSMVNLTPHFPYYFLDVENWLCDNGRVKQRVRRDAYEDAVVSGYEVRKLCGTTFDKGCQIVVTETKQVKLLGCSDAVTPSEKRRW